jgi:hypothetical protein
MATLRNINADIIHTLIIWQTTECITLTRRLNIGFPINVLMFLSCTHKFRFRPKQTIICVPFLAEAGISCFGVSLVSILVYFTSHQVDWSRIQVAGFWGLILSGESMPLWVRKSILLRESCMQVTNRLRMTMGNVRKTLLTDVLESYSPSNAFNAIVGWLQTRDTFMQVEK